MKRTVLAILAVAMTTAVVMAHDFSVTQNGNTIYFKITDRAARTAQVTYRGSITAHAAPACKGRVTIPATVRHGGVVYTINAIGAKAFAGATQMDSIIMPETISRVDDFAFDGCSRLSYVGMPTAQPTFGQGTFFRCGALQSVVFGSEWTTVDFSMFRWSDSLRVVTLPAKMERIQGLKTLRSLQRIDVAEGNTRYSSVGGCLYSTAAHTLLCVPRAYADTLCVADGTTTVMWGSITDCAAITAVELPASLQVLSFREFSQMPRLRSITFNAEAPISTANFEGHDILALWLSAGGVTVYVPKSSLKAYRQALVAKDGEYYDIVSGRPQSVSLQDAAKPYRPSLSSLLKANNLKAIKTK